MWDDEFEEGGGMKVGGGGGGLLGSEREVRWKLRPQNRCSSLRLKNVNKDDRRYKAKLAVRNQSMRDGLNR